MPIPPDTIHRLACTRHRTAIVIACGLLCAVPMATDAAPNSSAAAISEAMSARSMMLTAAAYARALGHAAAAQEAAAERSPGYAWRGPPAERPDWRGLGRDTAYFLGYQLAAVGVLYLAPESISGWDKEDKQHYSFSKWRRNVSNPEWDRDRWWINYITHPYWGAAYYVRGRERGLDRGQSFWYSALMSALFEYGAEALAEPVSIQDLAVTPVAGALVGEYLFSPWRARIRAKPGKLDWRDKAALFISDPLGVVNAATDRMLGVHTTLQVRPIDMPAPRLATEMQDSATDPSARVRLRAPAWGLQLRIQWL